MEETAVDESGGRRHPSRRAKGNRYQRIALQSVEGIERSWTLSKQPPKQRVRLVMETSYETYSGGLHLKSA